MQQTSQRDIEKIEEEKLKARYNNARPVTGHSAFLQKRLAKGVSIYPIKYLFFVLFCLLQEFAMKTKTQYLVIGSL